jgi:ankyrin repeat protein
MSASSNYRQTALLFVVSLVLGAGASAENPDRRLVDAAQAKDWATVAALIKKQVDVNVPQADGATALHWAAHIDDLIAADMLLKARANVNATNELGMTPLALACGNASAPMAVKLLAAGANPNAANQAGETVLMTASETGNVEIVDALLAKGANPNARERTQDQTALMWAVAEKHSAITRSLIKAGADVHARSKGGSTPLLFAARSGDIDTARQLLAAGADVNATMPDGNSVLLVAAGSGHGELGVLLLEHGANVNAVTNEEGLSPLHALVLKRPLHSAYWRRPAEYYLLARALLARGANPDHQITKAPTGMGINVTGVIWPGSTPFMLAARVADVEMMKVLAEGKADPRLAATNKTTSLMAAAGVGRSEGNEDPISEENSIAAVKMVVEMGVDINAADTNGNTALHGAVNNGYNAIIQYLFEKGANLNAKDKNGWTPLNIAENYRNNFREHKESAALLRQLGALENDPPPLSR